MKPLYTEKEFAEATSYDDLLLQCYQCGKAFLKRKAYISNYLKYKGKSRNGCKYCSTTCQSKGHDTRIICTCSQCGKNFTRRRRETIDSRKKFDHIFCSHSCAGIYSSAHKTHGCRRSKLEKYIEQQLKIIYPSLNILYNDVTAIKAELDIYIPSLNLAFELNGIFHYEPIFGKEKLTKVQSNDKRKFQACIENEIALCIMDVTSIKYLKKGRADQFLKIITDIIDQKLIA